MDQVAQAIAQSGLRGELAWTMFGQGDGRHEIAQAARFAEQWHGASGGRIRSNRLCSGVTTSLP